MTLGPLVGGALLATFWWGSAFLLGVPFMALLLAAGPVLLPEHRDSAAGRLDLTSVALSLGAILPVIYGLKEIARRQPACWSPASGCSCKPAPTPPAASRWWWWPASPSPAWASPPRWR
jgi:DHA2 family multidrug resistance protein-like MFS transporter